MKMDKMKIFRPILTVLIILVPVTIALIGYNMKTDDPTMLGPVGSPATIINQTEVKFNGDVNPVSVVEYIDSSGNRCLIARYGDREIALSCNYNRTK